MISEAYPPEKAVSNKTKAECHKIIRKHNIKIDPQKIKFILYRRGMKVDMEEIKALHKE